MQSERLLAAFDRATGVSTDTRSLRAGELFFALSGPNFDGNKYAKQALEQGASAAVVDDPTLGEAEGCILVDDALEALQVLAKAHRRRLTCPIIGLTGSNGKTTTKELLAAVLAQSYTVSSTVGNLNNHIGVPLTLLRIPRATEIAVVEMGANHQREIAALAAIAEPTHGAITNIGRAHLEGFGGIEGVRIGKGELFDYMAATRGYAFVDLANAEVSALAERVPKQLRYTSVAGIENEGAPALLACIQEEAYPLSSGYIEAGGKRVPYTSQLPGEHNHGNIAMAAAIGYYFKVPLAKIAAGIAGYEPSNSRSEERKIGESTVLMDAYNANPDSMLAGLRWLASRAESRKVAVLGTLAELGAFAKTSHREIAAAAAGIPGVRVAYFGEAWQESEVDDAYPGEVLTEVDELRNWLEPHYRNAETVILIKGSRSNRLERVLPTGSV